VRAQALVSIFAKARIAGLCGPVGTFSLLLCRAADNNHQSELACNCCSEEPGQRPQLGACASAARSAPVTPLAARLLLRRATA